MRKGDTMRRVYPILFGLLLISGLAVGPVRADGPYVDNNNGTVTDQGTRLMWQQADDGKTRDWQEAQTYCENLSLAGHQDWRLPSLSELTSLWEERENPPLIDARFYSQWGYYWSRSPCGEGEQTAYHDVGFGARQTHCTPGTNYNHVRCVRNQEGEGKLYAVPGTYTFEPLNQVESQDYPETESQAGGMAHDDRYDPPYLWFADRYNDTLYHLDGDGVIQSSFGTPDDEPAGLAFDGDYLWLADSGTDTIYQLDRFGGQRRSFDAPGSNPKGMVYAETFLWVVDRTEKQIYKLDGDGDVVESFEAPGASPTGLAYDGDDLWLSDTGDDKLYRINTDGEVRESLDMPDTAMEYISHDETDLWAGQGELARYSSDTAYFTLSNPGTRDSRVESVRITGANADAFELSSDPCSGGELGPSQDCRIGVRFAPKNKGNRSAVLEIGYINPRTEQAETLSVPLNWVEQGRVQFDHGEYEADESDEQVTITVTLDRVNAEGEAVSVEYKTSDGTAKSGSDYSAVSGTLRWEAGDNAPKTFTVSLINDDEDEADSEGDETFNLVLSNPSGARLGTPSTAVLTITEDEESGCFLWTLFPYQRAETALFR